MVVFRISVDLFGDNFNTNFILEKIDKGKYKVADVIRQEDLNNKGEEFGFSSISIEHPRQYGFSDNLHEYQTWVIDFLEKYEISLNKAKVEDIWVVVDVYYFDFCSIEVFDKGLLNRLNKFNVSIPMNVYKLPKQEIYDMLTDEGFEDSSMWELLRE